ncbi:cytochrome c oxidase assembly protein [Stutzerimonas tarimensis]|uniref:Cytochrome c oxidase assembly protein CtaG n=1 Tax=Stutzerimonas tarimensis TaxID=1507735 RepID=A0ABV7SZ55_9GAMM
MNDSRANTRLVRRLLLVPIVMFGFGFALVPLYDVLCEAFGINGKTAGAYTGVQHVDESREVRVQFLSINSSGMTWEFHPREHSVVVRPGETNEMVFIAHNPGSRPMTGQAVPSVAPAKAAAWFHKTECFCFTQQVLQAGERIEMPVRFIVDRALPADVHQVTLAYTLFDITARMPPVTASGRPGERP